MAVLGGHVWSKERKHQIAFWLMGVICSALIVIQGVRIGRSQKQATADITNLKQTITDLRQTLIDRDKEISKLTKQQLELQEKQFALNYEPSVEILYRNKRLEIYNEGKTNLFVWGIKYNGETKDVIWHESEIIAPGTMIFYEVLLIHKELEIIPTPISNGQPYRLIDLIPIEIFVKDAIEQKYIVKGRLSRVVVDGKLRIYSQTLGILKSDWSK